MCQLGNHWLHRNKWRSSVFFICQVLLKTAKETQILEWWNRTVPYVVASITLNKELLNKELSFSAPPFAFPFLCPFSHEVTYVIFILSYFDSVVLFLVLSTCTFGSAATHFLLSPSLLLFSWLALNQLLFILLCFLLFYFFSNLFAS